MSGGNVTGIWDNTPRDSDSTTSRRKAGEGLFVRESAAHLHSLSTGTRLAPLEMQCSESSKRAKELQSGYFTITNLNLSSPFGLPSYRETASRR